MALVIESPVLVASFPWLRRCSYRAGAGAGARFSRPLMEGGAETAGRSVPIGVEDECGVLPGVIVRSQPGPSVVDPSRLDGCGVERINRFAHGYCRRESSQHRGLGRRRGARP